MFIEIRKNRNENLKKYINQQENEFYIEKYNLIIKEKSFFVDKGNDKTIVKNLPDDLNLFDIEDIENYFQGGVWQYEFEDQFN